MEMHPALVIMSIEKLSTDYDKIVYLRTILIAKSTNKEAYSDEYEVLRYQLRNNSRISSLLPEMVHENKNLTTFWSEISKLVLTHHKREIFITDAFKPAIDLLENKEIIKADNKEASRHDTQSNALSPTRKESDHADLSDFNAKKKKKSKVFVVHGHDNETKQEIARFLEKNGLTAIILHEQASSGMTIIEKIEHYSSEADFAVVLYTPCDLGRGVCIDKSEFKSRARQNVVFEHGYLMSKLGRENVCALVKDGVETPNDISGVVYVALDSNGAWKNEIITELKACGYTI